MSGAHDHICMSKTYRLTASTAIHKGDREHQQDQVTLIAHARHKGCVLAGVADGMGGGRGGRKSSRRGGVRGWGGGGEADGMGGRSGGRKAADQVMMTARQLFERYSPDTDDPLDLLARIVQESHIVIRLTAISSEQEPHSTIAAFLINPQGDCHWMHAGDSRIYHFRGAELAFRTCDHSYVQELVSRGELTEEQANDHPQSNILIHCLGADSDPPLTSHLIAQLQPGDALLACSDGVWHYFTTAELAAVVDALSPREASQILIEKARIRARGDGDNLSLVIVKIEARQEEETIPASLPPLAAHEGPSPARTG